MDQVRTSTTRQRLRVRIRLWRATATAAGVNFAVYSQHASDVFRCSFAADEQPTDVIALAGPTNGVWHIHVDGVAPGRSTVTGWPDRTTRRRSAVQQRQVVLDPYAKAVTGKFRNTDNLLLADDPQPGAGEQTLDARDSGPVVPKPSSSTTPPPLAGRCTPDIGTRGADHLRGAHQRVYRTPTPRGRDSGNISASSRRFRIYRRWGSTPSTCRRCTSTTWTTSC